MNQIKELQLKIENMKENEAIINNVINDWNKKIIIYTDFLNNIENHQNITKEEIIEQIQVFKGLKLQYKRDLEKLKSTLYVFESILNQLNEDEQE